MEIFDLSWLATERMQTLVEARIRLGLVEKAGLDPLEICDGSTLEEYQSVFKRHGIEIVNLSVASDVSQQWNRSEEYRIIKNGEVVDKFKVIFCEIEEE